MERPLFEHGHSFNAIVRRTFDACVALIALLFFFPVMLVIACCIKLDTPGPILFSQIRLGYHGKQFRLYKFRKFGHGTPSGGRSVTLKGDARMTRFGRLLERTKLDELPQFWNVLVGEMSVVGPRPEALDFADCFTGPYRAVLDHKPGLFGPNQVIFRSESALYPKDRDPHEFYRAVLFPTKARIDLAYFPQRTFLSDIGWTIRTALAVFGLATARASLCLTDDEGAAEFSRESSPSISSTSDAAEHAR